MLKQLSMGQGRVVIADCVLDNAYKLNSTLREMLELNAQKGHLRAIAQKTGVPYLPNDTGRTINNILDSGLLKFTIML